MNFEKRKERGKWRRESKKGGEEGLSHILYYFCIFCMYFCIFCMYFCTGEQQRQVVSWEKRIFVRQVLRRSELKQFLLRNLFTTYKRGREKEGKKVS